MKTKEEKTKGSSELFDEALNNVNGGLDHDTNTDEDRRSIQKEIDQSIAQIDDNALTL